MAQFLGLQVAQLHVPFNMGAGDPNSHPSIYLLRSKHLTPLGHLPNPYSLPHNQVLLSSVTSASSKGFAFTWWSESDCIASASVSTFLQQQGKKKFIKVKAGAQIWRSCLYFYFPRNSRTGVSYLTLLCMLLRRRSKWRWGSGPRSDQQALGAAASCVNGCV